MSEKSKYRRLGQIVFSAEDDTEFVCDNIHDAICAIGIIRAEESRANAAERKASEAEERDEWKRKAEFLECEVERLRAALGKERERTAAPAWKPGDTAWRRINTKGCRIESFKVLAIINTDKNVRLVYNYTHWMNHLASECYRTERECRLARAAELEAQAAKLRESGGGGEL